MTVTVLRLPSTERDEYGDPPDPVEPARIPIPGCQIAPRLGGPGTASSEIHKHGRDGLTEGLTLYNPNPRADIRHTDQIEHAGDVYDIEGRPAVWGTAGIEVALRRTAG